MIKAYPTGLPEGIHLNINLSVQLGVDTEPQVDVKTSVEEAAPVGVTPPVISAGPSYKGQFLGLFRVVARDDSRRIKIRSDFDMAAPEASVKLTDRQYAFIKALNLGRMQYFENSGLIFTSNNGTQNIFYKQYGFDKQLLVVSEIRRVGDTTMGRVVGIGSDPYLSDPKPLDAAATNYKNTPWLVHLIDGVQIYAPILTADSTPGWINMREVEKVR
jgi:hypothetical protein